MKPSLEEIEGRAHEGTIVPVYLEVMADLETPISAYLKLGGGEGSFLLESVEGGKQLGRYSFMGLEPDATVTFDGARASLRDRMGDREEEAADPLEWLHGFLSQEQPVHVANLPRFSGGAVGYFSYELARHIERLPKPAGKGLGLPLGKLGIYRTVLAFDHLHRSIKIITHISTTGDIRSEYEEAESRLATIAERLAKAERLPSYERHHESLPGHPESLPCHPERSEGSLGTGRAFYASEEIPRSTLGMTVEAGASLSLVPLGMTEESGASNSRSALGIAAESTTAPGTQHTGNGLPRGSASAPTSNLTQEQFESAIRRAKEYIAAGDAIQVVLSQRLSVPCEASALSVFRALRFINPSPYMYLLDYGSFQIVGASPEMLVRVEDGTVSVHPIAGTRPRGHTPAEDARMEEELTTDEKERAEHFMLVDLGRNDVGRVSEAGSVRVTELMGIESYSHVMHMVSHVEGELRAGLRPVDAVKAAFPAGTVSGAPKVRAMEIIAELEPDERGPYSGAVGYFGFDGNLDTAIALRTVVLSGGVANVQVGAGIVADSQPDREFEETMNKAKGVLRAVDLPQSGAFTGGSVDRQEPTGPHEPAVQGAGR